MKNALTALFTGTLLWDGAAYSETLYVTSPTAELKSATTASATVIAQLNRGDSVAVTSKSGNWIQVSAAGKKGWVYKFKLSNKKPSGEGGNALAGLGGGGASAREGSTASSIRGLSPTSEKYAGRANIRPEHVAMVKHMESSTVSKNDVDALLKAGKLGEYAQ